MGLRTVGFGTVGLLATAAAALVVFGPASGASLVALVGSVEPRTALVLGSLAVGFCAALAARIAGPDSRSSTAYDRAVDSPPEEVTATESQLVAADVDAAIDDAVAGDRRAMMAVTDRLAETATTAYAVSAGVSRETAREAIKDGTWTDDDVAAALLSPAKPHPLLARLRLWLDPESERERRVRRTVDAIERVAGGAA